MTTSVNTDLSRVIFLFITLKNFFLIWYIDIYIDVYIINSFKRVLLIKVMDKNTAVKTIKCSKFQLHKHAHSVLKCSNDKNI